MMNLALRQHRSQPDDLDLESYLEDVPEIVAVYGKKEQAEAHARVCRAAAAAGEPRPVWQGGSFRGVDLAGADLSGADFADTDFMEAKLCGVNFAGAKLNGACFIKADLRGAKLSNSQLVGASFYRADLSGADLRGARIEGASFEEAERGGADMTGAVTGVSMTSFWVGQILSPLFGWFSWFGALMVWTLLAYSAAGFGLTGVLVTWAFFAIGGAVVDVGLRAYKFSPRRQATIDAVIVCLFALVTVLATAVAYFPLLRLMFNLVVFLVSGNQETP